MNGNDIRLRIATALSGFPQRPLPDVASELFASLGYGSERRIKFPSLVACFAEFDRENKAAKFFAEISAAKGSDAVLVQQLTSEEIAAGSGGQLSLLSSPKFDPRQFESYLFIAVPLPDADYTRTELAIRARALNALFPQPVLVLFRHGANISLAITYRRTSKRDQSRDIIERKVTLIKDIACAQPHRAHLDILADFALESLAGTGARIDTFAKLDDAWRRVLSTQQLNESFYSELAGWYYWATSTIRLPIVPEHLSHRKDAKEENIKQFTIRLLCRSIFCWFLKERGLISPRLLELADVTGQPVILTRPAKSAAEFAKSNSYYRGILQNIFFNCLNTSMDKRRLPADRAANDKTVKDPRLKKLAYRGKNYLPDDFDYSLFDRIPYLNGGLFDCLPEDNASDSIDDEKISVPNRLFHAVGERLQVDKKTLEVSGLNRILERYKFTITENTPLEEEIALDPELLGLVFENLLAEVDVSDEGAAKSARKASGSYYTPRRVIDYMVNESLRLHLEGFCRQRGANADEIIALTELIYHDEFDASKHPRLADWIVEAFDSIRILDPACGSGAFPMGALHRMVDILRRVDSGNERWLHRQVGGIPDTRLRRKAEQDLKRHADDYSRKLGLIKNAIYGVDIQPLAVLLTKLRFFISLLVDQKLNPNDAAHNYGLTPLPNLETKVLCANTLREMQVSLFEREAIRRYQAARDEYYQPDTTTERHEQLTDEIAAALAELLPSFAKDVTGQEIKDRPTQSLRNRELLKEWFRHSSLPAPFFNFSVFYPEVCPEVAVGTLTGDFAFTNQVPGQQSLVNPQSAVRDPQSSGFDLVIGNPPYGGTKLPDDVQEALGLDSKDPYGAFIARFLGDGRKTTPLKPDGILSFIVSDTFMTIKSHRPLREQIMGSRIHKMIRVHRDTFQAVVNTAIIVVQKGGGPGTTAPPHDVLARLWVGQQRGAWCQMVDLTQVSIYKQHDRFLTLLFDTAGTARRRDIATESCAAYHYPQALIATNSNLPFFVASPKLFVLMQDNDNAKTLNEASLPNISYQVSINGKSLRLFKLGDDYDRRGRSKQWRNVGLFKVVSGIKTGSNVKYLRAITEDAQKTLPPVDVKLVLTSSEAESLPDNQKQSGILGRRHFVRFEMGMPADTDIGLLPCYHQEDSSIAIDWSPAAVKGMQNEGHSDLANEEFRFLPQQRQISFSFAGFYAPTFRTANAPLFLNAASRLILRHGDDGRRWLALLNSKLARFLMRNFVNHTVNFGVEDVKAFPTFYDIQALEQLAGEIVRKQQSDPSYDYATNEQLEIDRLVYEAYGLNRADIAEVETWYARRYDTLATAQRLNLRRAGKVPAIDGWNVYCDETGHLPCDRAPEMILGAMLVPRDRVRPLTDILRERLAKLGWPRTKAGGWAELKWTKVSPGGLKFYEAALDFFLAEPDLRFRALIAPKSPPPPKLPKPPAGSSEPGSPAWENYHALLEQTAPAVVDHQQRHDAWYYDRYFDLLRDTLLPPAHHHIYVDVKDTRGGKRIRELESRLSDAHYDWTRSGIVESVQQIHSDEVLLDQIVDVLLGCVAWTHATPQRNSGHQPSPAKAALAKKFQGALAELDGALVPKVVIDRSSERSPAA
jgi:hypothetical protein